MIFTPAASFQNNTSGSVISGINSLQSGQRLSQTDNDLSTRSNGYNINSNLLFRHAFAKRGRTVSINFNTALNKKDGKNYLVAENRYYKSITDISDSAVNQFSDQASHSHQYSVNIAYTEPVGKKGQFQFNYDPSFLRSAATRKHSSSTRPMPNTLFLIPVSAISSIVHLIHKTVV